MRNPELSKISDEDLMSAIKSSQSQSAQPEQPKGPQTIIDLLRKVNPILGNTIGGAAQGGAQAFGGINPIENQYKQAMTQYLQQGKLPLAQQQGEALSQKTPMDIQAKKASIAKAYTEAGMQPPPELFQEGQAGEQPQTITGLPPDQDKMAQDVANYKMDMKTALMRVPYALKSKFSSGVTTANPTYDQKQYQSRQDYQNSLSSGPIAKNITALNTVIPHIDRLNQSLQALGNGKIPLLNTVKNWFAKSTGSGNVGRAETDLVATSNEIESVYRATGGTEEGIRAWRAGQPTTSASPDQQKQWVQEGLGLIEGRIGAMGNDYQQNMGEAAPPNRFMSQPNEQIMNRLGGQSNGNPLSNSSGGNSGGGSPEGTVISNGKQRMIKKGGQWQPMQ